MAQDWSIFPTPAKPREHQVLLLSCWRPAQLDAAGQTLAFLLILTLLSPPSVRHWANHIARCSKYEP